MTNDTEYCLGIDIGSTTVKAVLRQGGKTVYEKYERHYSEVRKKTCELLNDIKNITGTDKIYAAVSGSAGLGLAGKAGLPFVQEVFATGEVIKVKEPDASCVIELGGEDAKIIFFDNGNVDERMNGSCAGGTGAFIDQMATLLNVSVSELDSLSMKSERVYPIASRCGVFAKTDIQPLLNQGAKKEDIAASIFRAVVNQTVAGLAQGKKISGKVLFLGGPLYYCFGLRKAFKEILKLDDVNAVFPEYARFAVAFGASLYAEKQNEIFTADELIAATEKASSDNFSGNCLKPLFKDEKEYAEFKERHSASNVKYKDIHDYCGKAYLGIDCGSTTTKLVLLSENNEILYSYYASNQGNPVEIVRQELNKIYSFLGDRIVIAGSAATGYGEELIKNAFSVDYGLVETIAHYMAAKYFEPDVDFILDIGGQDIKCFKIKNGAIDSIMLNEACSSGCGSFLETFAKAMGYGIADFAAKGIYGKHPVNLGSRCTVFMNSSVKQSQKDGATVEDISAGLSVSVVKNAVYKVIRASSAKELGTKIVVQGGTFYNDAVLRAFERELGFNVVRPTIAGLMGAYGAALYSKKTQGSHIISKEDLQKFVHTSKPVVCHGCQNMCSLTVNSFVGGNNFISGNRCEKALGLKTQSEKLPNLYEFKRNYLENLKPCGKVTRNLKIGLPFALGMYELLPLWKGIFTALGFEVVVSDMSTRVTYEKGQFSIPSDTACYPAKIMHGHIAELIEKKVDCIFYPCLSYNIDEKGSDNHYNCPVVAYYSELLNGNVEELKKVKFLYPFLNINDDKQLSKEIYRMLKPLVPKLKKNEVSAAIASGKNEYNIYMDSVAAEGEKAVAFARANNKRVMILAGRLYHIDSEICHGIDKLVNSLGFAVVSEDSICRLAEKQNMTVKVLNQWTYHARLYRAAEYACENKNTELVQLVSFGCGVDAITSDEVRSILESKGKFYTQLKIDEITNLGAVKIRLRSLLGALEEKDDGRN